MHLNDAVRTDMDQAVLCWLATVSSDGTPNVSPKEIFAPHGESGIVIADIASPISVRHARSNPKVCVSFIDIFRQRGFKITGEATVHGSEDVEFAALVDKLLPKAGGAFEIKHVFHIRIGRVARIWAPSYTVFPERSEEERMEGAFRAYGVRPHPMPAPNSSAPAFNRGER